MLVVTELKLFFFAIIWQSLEYDGHTYITSIQILKLDYAAEVVRKVSLDVLMGFFQGYVITFQIHKGEHWIVKTSTEMISW